MKSRFPIPSSIQDLERAPYDLLPYPEDFADDNEAARADSFTELVNKLERGNHVLKNSDHRLFSEDEDVWLDEERMQALYTLVRKSTSLSLETRNDLVQVLADAIKSLADILVTSNDVVSQAFRDAWACHVYMIYTFTFLNEAHRKETGFDSEYRSIAAKTLLTAAHHMAKYPNLLWQRGVVDESVIILPCRTAYTLLEVSSGVINRKTACGDTALQILEVSLSHTSILSLITTSLMDMMHSMEHMSTIVAELCAKSETLSVELLREVARLDGMGIKNVAPFVSSLAASQPRLVLKHMPQLMFFLNSEPYTMRNALITAIGHILQSLAHNNAESENSVMFDASKARENLLSVLSTRIYDTSSYTRATVLRTWISLIQSKSLPKDHFLPVTRMAVDRLQDRTVIVRKQALLLISELLENNPFMGNLDPAPYRTKLNELYTYMKENMPPHIRGANEAAMKDAEESEDAVAMQEVERAALAASLSEADTLLEHTENLSSADKEFCTKALALKFTQSALDFIDLLEDATSTFESLMLSNNTTDVTESLRFFVKAKHFQLPCAVTGMKHALALMWSQEVAIREEVLKAFVEVFITVPGSEGTENLPSKRIANNLVQLVDKANKSELASIEEAICHLVKENRIPAEVFGILWSAVANDHENRTNALQLIAMGATADRSIIDSKSRLKLLLDTALGDHAEDSRDWAAIGAAAVLLQRVPRAKIDLSDAKYLILERLMEQLCTVAQGDWCLEADQADTLQWFSAAEQAIKALFVICPEPEAACRTIIVTMSHFTFERRNSLCHPLHLARFFHILGQISLNLLVYTEALSGSVRRGNAKRAVKMQEEADKTKRRTSTHEDDDIEAELGIAQAAEAENERNMAEISEREILNRGLMGKFGPLLARVVANEGGRFDSNILMEASVLALTKFMCVSSQFCEKHLPLLFTALSKAPPGDTTLRANTVVALGDLAFRFPNEVEPYTPHLYACLRDNSTKVRRHTLMVLTHLVLNDMVKVKGQVCEIALCLRDNDPRIRDMSRLLFHELSKRSNNPVYNLLPDIISQLSQQAMQKEDFRGIMSFLLGYVKKDRQNEMLTEKLCQRFPKCSSLDQTADLVFCLSQLKMNEKTIKCLSDSFKLYKDALCNEDVKKQFLIIVGKAKKSAKPESRQFLDEWENKISETAAIEAENEAVGQKAAKAKKSKKPKRKQPLRSIPQEELDDE
ncbi:condensin complex subunit 1 [Fistulifera solaris]|uniref:Condensin complex subunit 1 n=1 Tax=Fistulifera solaris TaxID=1519565 RepID=A0A1Z5JDF9_FISSO|nr:condensin complex subunit 1 [Fistulifera solaris]|eukprot:GAX12009.1 condensin complex subunit 1 [Fistulifera solaris]